MRGLLKSQRLAIHANNCRRGKTYTGWLSCLHPSGYFISAPVIAHSQSLPQNIVNPFLVLGVCSRCQCNAASTRFNRNNSWPLYWYKVQTVGVCTRFSAKVTLPLVRLFIFIHSYIHSHISSSARHRNGNIVIADSPYFFLWSVNAVSLSDATVPHMELSESGNHHRLTLTLIQA